MRFARRWHKKPRNVGQVTFRGFSGIRFQCLAGAWHGSKQGIIKNRSVLLFTLQGFRMNKAWNCMHNITMLLCD